MVLVHCQFVRKLVLMAECFIVLQRFIQGSHSPGKLMEICYPGKVEFYARPGIFGMISRFTLV